MVRGSPCMCISTTSQPSSAAAARLVFSPPSAVMSFQIVAPADVAVAEAESAIAGGRAAFLSSGGVEAAVGLLALPTLHPGLQKLPSLAEAACAPVLFRMLATLPVLRDLELVVACEVLGLDRVTTWIKEVRPHDHTCAVTDWSSSSPSKRADGLTDLMACLPVNA